MELGAEFARSYLFKSRRESLFDISLGIDAFCIGIKHRDGIVAAVISLGQGSSHLGDLITIALVFPNDGLVIGQKDLLCSVCRFAYRGFEKIKESLGGVESGIQSSARDDDLAADNAEAAFVIVVKCASLGVFGVTCNTEKDLKRGRAVFSRL